MKVNARSNQLPLINASNTQLTILYAKVVLLAIDFLKTNFHAPNWMKRQNVWCLPNTNALNVKMVIWWTEITISNTYLTSATNNYLLSYLNFKGLSKTINFLIIDSPFVWTFTLNIVKRLMSKIILNVWLVTLDITWKITPVFFIQKNPFWTVKTMILPIPVKSVFQNIT